MLPECCTSKNDPYETAIIWRQDGYSDEDVTPMWEHQKRVIEKVRKQFNIDSNICLFPIGQGSYGYDVIFGNWYAMRSNGEMVSPHSIVEDREDEVIGVVPAKLRKEIEKVSAGTMQTGWFEKDEEDYWFKEAETFNAQRDGEKLMVGSREYNDGSMMVGIGTEYIGSQDPDFMEMMIGEDGEIEYFTMPTGVNHYQRLYKPKPAHYGKMKTQNETNESAGGDFIRTDGDGKHAETFNAEGGFKKGMQIGAGLTVGVMGVQVVVLGLAYGVLKAMGKE